MAWQRWEKALLLVGLGLIGLYLAVRIHGWVSSQLALRRFEAERIAARVRAQESVKERTGEDVDFALWSDKRVQAYVESVAIKNEMASAVLRIPKLRLEVPVYDGTDDLTLNRGVGRIIGTARLGESGNTGIAGHRDGFFRGLKDVQQGDAIELILPTQTSRFVVDDIQITVPEDVSVLKLRAKPSLTLVTCYPFYFIGSAPQRYIVSASLAGSEPSATPGPSPVSVPQLSQRRD